MLPSTHNPDAQSGKVALFSNTGGMVLYGAAISYCLMLFSFLCVPSAVLSTFLTGVVKTGSVEKIAPDKLMFPAIFSSFPYWSTEAFLLLLVCMALCLAIAFRICNLVSKYSSCKTSKISILVLAVIGFFPASIALEFLGYSQYSHTLQFIEGLNTGSFLYILDRMINSGLLMGEAVQFLLLGFLLKAVLFPQAQLKMLPSGLSIEGGFWKILVGEKFIGWDELQSVVVTGVGEKKQLNLFLKDGNRYSLRLSAVQKSLNLTELMNEIKTYAPAALSPNLLAMIDEGKNAYTELWLKYFSSSSSRERTGALKTGEVLNEGRYEIAGELGQGGQGTAYLAALTNPQQEDEGTTIVLKEYILPVHRGEAIFQQSLRKLQQEAEILGKIQHPNIVELKETFVEDHRGYLVMEYVDGENLKPMVQAQGPQPEQVVIDIAIQVCNALEHLHNMDPAVIHRDLTPDNLILQKNGIVKLVDFNVAHQLESSATATVVGKHAYIPAEQFRGKPTPQSDIFALGGTMHFLLSAKEPEPLSSSHPAAVNESVSKELDAIVAKATALDQKDRYQNAFELRAALYDLARERGYILNSAVSATIKTSEAVAEHSVSQ